MLDQGSEFDVIPGFSIDPRRKSVEVVLFLGTLFLVQFY